MPAHGILETLTSNVSSLAATTPDVLISVFAWLCPPQPKNRDKYETRRVKKK